MAPDAVLVFASAAYDQGELLRSIVDQTGDVPLCGCTGEGVITQAGSDECSHVVAVMAIVAPGVTFRTFAVAELGADSEVAGRKLAAQVARHATADDLLVLFPDGIHGNCRKLLNALQRGLDNGRPPPTIVGGTAGDLFQFERTFQYRDGHVFSDGVAALLISGVDAELVISHGCDLVGEPQTITKTDGCFIEEIDGQRAWDLFKSYLDDDAETLEAMHVAHLLLAERIQGPVPESFAPFTVRVPVRLDATRGALYFAAGLEEGTPVQVALRNPEKVCERAVQAARQLVDERGRPALILQLDCAGRGRLLFDEETTERIVEPVQRAIGKDVPWLGLHTYGEIAPVGTETLFHNYTGVLCALYPRS
ncbi:MAG TPA: hypothetical protein ENK57_01840 [Polyangiaceae bacterium]|nr:hypothetical protein [Polyangiaceae bacterium]